MRVELARVLAPLDQAGEPGRDRFVAGTVLVGGRGDGVGPENAAGVSALALRRRGQ
ncbi:hypothetical protein AB0K02_01320 [Streptomyces sp. NPDC049597]|uniref:hypothetical protein n=1 Tax=Streptomyces sp. NPDC049597 TaxID=3155276 RepID=UPI0034279440